MKRTIAIAMAIGAGGYLAVILLGGLIFSGCIESRIESRLSRALAADVEVKSTSVFIASGNVTLRGVSIRRDGVEVDIDRVDVSMRGGGLMLVSGRLESIVVSATRAAFSARGAVALAQRERKPLHIDRLVLRDATLSISPTLILPGLGRIEATIEQAQSRDVDLSSVISWISDLDTMVATLSLPAGAGAGVDFRDGQLALTGTFFGKDALSLPFKIPELSPDALEIDHLATIGKALLKAVGKHVAKDKLLDMARDLF